MALSSYRYLTIEPHHVPSLAEAIGEAFRGDEISNALGDTDEDLLEWGRDDAPKYLRSRLTVVAVEPSSELVVGFATVHELAYMIDTVNTTVGTVGQEYLGDYYVAALLSRNFTFYVDHVLPDSLRLPVAADEQPLRDLVAQPIHARVVPDTCAYLDLLGVRAEYRRQGIAKRAVEAALDVAKQRGLQRMILIATSIGSQALFGGSTFANATDASKPYRFTRLHSVPYHEFVVPLDGSRPFGRITNPPQSELFECIL